MIDVLKSIQILKSIMQINRISPNVDVEEEVKINYFLIEMVILMNIMSYRSSSLKIIHWTLENFSRKLRYLNFYIFFCEIQSQSKRINT